MNTRLTIDPELLDRVRDADPMLDPRVQAHAALDTESALRLLAPELDRPLGSRRARQAGGGYVRLRLRGQPVSGHGPPRRRRRARLKLGLAAVAATAAAVAGFALVGTTGSGGPGSADAAVIHRTLTAITPPADEILHVKVVGAQNGVAETDETWQETNAPYPGFVRNGIPAIGGWVNPPEFASIGTTGFHYDPATNTISERPDSARPGFRDDVSLIRQELAHGQARVAGTVVIDGTLVRRIDLPQGQVAYFDNNSYQPRYLDVPQSDGSTLRLRVAVYEYLPMTPANRALLSMTARHPTARVVVTPNSHSGTHSAK